MQGFLRKLASFASLDMDDAQAVEALLSDVRPHPAGATIVSQGDLANGVQIMLEGWACRYKTLAEGKRQIVDFLLPGDLCDGPALYVARMDHSIATLSRCRLAHIRRADFVELVEQHPRIAQALWYVALVQESVAREWIANVGARRGEQRLAHLICELCFRLRAVSERQDQACDLPITQFALAEATGLTVVHVNRLLQDLRRKGMVILRQRMLSVEKPENLRALADFDPSYLEPNGGAIVNERHGARVETEPLK